MHLESLLADLDSQFEQYERSARAAQAWELAEAEAGRTALVDRLRAVAGGALTVTTRSGRQATASAPRIFATACL